MALKCRPSIAYGLALGAVLAIGCGDAVQDKEREGLGPEAPGVRPGPLHRPGQPCLVCHDGGGPGSSDFSLAGTVYQTAASKEPMADVLVSIIDSKGREYRTGTNCAGNFFVMKADYEPVWPAFIKLGYGQTGGQPFTWPMSSPIYREGSCAHCHMDPPGPEAPGHVYMFPPEVAVPKGQCQQ